MEPQAPKPVIDWLDSEEYIDWEKQYYYCTEPQFCDHYEAELLNTLRVD